MDDLGGSSIPSNVLRHFDLSSTPYDEITTQSIQSRRASCPGQQLFFDRLLALAEIDGSELYPPTSPAGYRHLLGAIRASPLDRLKKDCFYYYLLKDYDLAPGPEEGDGSGITRAAVFAKTRCLSKTWRTFMDGYWNLDNGFWENGISSLTYPGITEINFPSEIVTTLATLASPPSLACSLIHSFLLTRLPSAGDVDIYAVALASASSVGNAFSYIRSIDSSQQPHLRDIVWSWALGAPKTPCGKGEHVVQQKAIKEILHLPLLAEEDDHLLQFLLEPPRAISSNALSLLHDLVTLRLIHQGKYAESLTLDKELAGSGGKEEDRQRRREMVREFIAILPEAQRRALALDGEVIAVRREKQRGNGYMEIDDQAQDRSAGSAGKGMEMDISPAKRSQTKPYRNITPAFPLDKPAAAPAPAAPSTTSRPASPAPGSRVVSTHSPFSGPPRFAPHPNLPSSPLPQAGQLQRVLSGSPFTLPMSKGANAVRSASISRTPTLQSKTLPTPVALPVPIPRPKARAVRDEDQDEPKTRDTRKRTRTSDVRERGPEDRDEGAPSEAKEEGQEEAPSPSASTSAPDPTPTFDDAKELTHDNTEQVSDHTEEEAPPISIPEPEPEPEPTPRTRRSKRTTTVSPPPAPAGRRATRQSSVPPSPRERLPGSYIDNKSKANIPESVPEDSALQSQSQPQFQPATPSLSRARKSRTTRDLSAAATDAPAPQGIQGRSRMTRSASRATLGEPEDLPAPKRARSRRLSGASEMSVPDMSMTPATGRRSTRQAQAEQSEKGSPTPSVRSRRAGSQTPRKSTRAKK